MMITEKMITKIIKKVIQISLIMSLAFGFNGVLIGQETKKEPKVATVTKEIEGEVSWIGRGYISVVFERDVEKATENEILLPLDKDLKIYHKKSLEEIKPGDTVRIQYEEITEEYPEGRRREFSLAKAITFLKPAKAKQDMQTLVSEEKERGLPLKGMKGE
ncbi:MAG: hypothetical protein NC908_02770 [Candidatus Omnitrophica bacterium]|nr:hypothetical protein [Candidatus Omnitrophota bacterium]